MHHASRGRGHALESSIDIIASPKFVCIATRPSPNARYREIQIYIRYGVGTFKALEHPKKRKKCSITMESFHHWILGLVLGSWEHRQGLSITVDDGELKKTQTRRHSRTYLRAYSLTLVVPSIWIENMTPKKENIWASERSSANAERLRRTNTYVSRKQGKKTKNERKRRSVRIFSQPAIILQSQLIIHVLTDLDWMNEFFSGGPCSLSFMHFLLLLWIFVWYMYLSSYCPREKREKDVKSTVLVHCEKCEVCTSLTHSLTHPIAIYLCTRTQFIEYHRTPAALLLAS